MNERISRLLEGDYTVSPAMEHFFENFHGEWKYHMRRAMQEIIPGLYLGPYSAAVKSSLNTLEAAGITHIICVRQQLEAGLIKPHFYNKFEYLVLEIADSSSENILKFFSESNDFIEKCISSGGKCLVHSSAGISRSATLVIAYIMQKYGFNFPETYRMVQQRRFCVAPNEGFMTQLAEFEPIYRAAQHIEGNDSRPKRKFDEVESSFKEIKACQSLRIDQDNFE